MNGRLRTLDGLRGLAVALVVLYHLWLFSWLAPTIGAGAASFSTRTYLETGFIGVELFFFISGFCLFLPHARAMIDGAARPSIGAFVERRVTKIVPSYYLAVAVTALFAARSLNVYGDLPGALWSHLTFTSALSIEGFREWNGVFWSLSIEAQFYLMFPLVAAIARRAPLAVIGAMIAIAIAYRYSTAACCAGDYIRTQQLPTYLDLFAIGMAAAIGLVAVQARAPHGRLEHGAWTALSMGGFVLFVLGVRAVSAALANDHGWVLWQRSGQTALALVWALIAIATASSASWWRRVVANPVLLFLSGVSYNLYLWHVLVIMVMLHYRLVPYHGRDMHADPGWQAAFVVVAAVLGLAIATSLTYGFERPVMAWSRASLRRVRGLPSAGLPSR